MSENNYGALMMKSALPTSQDLKSVVAPGCYPVIAGNPTAPGKLAGSLRVLLTTGAANLLFSASDGNTYKPTPTGWIAFGETKSVNGHTPDSSGAVAVSSQDIFDAQAVHLGESADLNDYTTPGLYYQPANVNAQAGKNYPEPYAGSLEVYKHAGVTQVYRIHNISRSFIRAFYNGVWSAWVMQYDKDNRPTASETGALAITGGNLTGDLKVGIAGKDATVDANFYKADGTYLPGTIQRYLPQCSNANNAPFGFSYVGGDVANFPATTIYGTLLTMCTAGTRGFANIQPPTMDIWYQQIFFGTDSIQYVRTQTNTGGWSAWSRLASTDYVENRLQNIQVWVNQRISDVQNWTSQNFISSMDLTAPVDVGFRDGTGYPRGTDGAAMYNFQMVGGDANVGYFVIRYHRFYRNGQWVTLN